MKILKLKPVLQRSLTHPLTVTPEVSRPQGGDLPGTKLDSSFAKVAFALSLYHLASDSKEALATVAAKDSERPPAKDQPRDPRLFRRMGVSPETKGRCLQDPQPLSPQYPGATPPLGEPGCVSPQAVGSLAEQPSAASSGHRPRVPSEPPAAGTDAASDQRKCDQEGEHSHRRETRASSEGDQERRGSAGRHTKRNSSWDSRTPEREDCSSKKRKLP